MVRLCKAVCLVSFVVSFLLSCSGDSTSKYLIRRSEFTEASKSIVELIKLQGGLKPEQVKLGRVHSDDSRVGTSLFFDFLLEINGQKFEFTSSEKVAQWSWIKPLQGQLGSELHVTHPYSPRDVYDYEIAGKEIAFLPEFELSGPAELWMENASDLTLAIPHPVDAGEVRKIILADGARVVIKGAREIHLARPVPLPLPLPSELPSLGELASGEFQQIIRFLYASSRLKFRRDGKPLLVLRITEPLGLRSASIRHPLPLSSPYDGTNSISDENRGLEKGMKLKAKRLSPIAVELESRENYSEGNGLTEHGISSDLTSWPSPSLNFARPSLVELNKTIARLLGKALNQKGTFQIVRASIQVSHVVRFPIEVDFSVRNFTAVSKPRHSGGDIRREVEKEELVHREQFEVVARITPEGNLLPLDLKSLGSVNGLILIPSWLLLSGNVTDLPSLKDMKMGVY